MSESDTETFQFDRDPSGFLDLIVFSCLQVVAPALLKTPLVVQLVLLCLRSARFILSALQHHFLFWQAECLKRIEVFV